MAKLLSMSISQPLKVSFLTFHHFSITRASALLSRVNKSRQTSSLVTFIKFIMPALNNLNFCSFRLFSKIKVLSQSCFFFASWVYHRYNPLNDGSLKSGCTARPDLDFPGWPIDDTNWQFFPLAISIFITQSGVNSSMFGSSSSLL